MSNENENATTESTPQLVELKSVVARIAEATGKPLDKTAKKVRGRIRSNFDDWAEFWPGLGGEGKQNKDNSRYPAMPAETAQALFETFVPTKDEDEATEDEAVEA